jgi:preprotein translocase subunit Sec61beta
MHSPNEEIDLIPESAFSIKTTPTIVVVIIIAVAGKKKLQFG